MNKPNCLKRHELKTAIWETLCEYPQGATAHKVANRIRYSHTYIRLVLNEMAAERPDLIYYVVDKFKGLDRKTYCVYIAGRIEE